MKNKKMSVVVTLFTMILLVCMLTACGKKYVQQTETAVFFTVDENVMKNVEGKKLVDYMNALVEKKALSYELNGTMIVTINNLTANASDNEYWFIYSDDADNTTEAWGVAEGKNVHEKFNGKTFYSTNFGITDQPLTMGATYVFMISKF